MTKYLPQICCNLLLPACIWVCAQQNIHAQDVAGPPLSTMSLFLEKTKGNSIQISLPTFNSLGITPEQFIADLKKADIKTVHYFVGFCDGSVNDNLYRKEYMQALKENGIGIWYMTLGQGFYATSTPLPESWQVETYPSSKGQVIKYSFHNDDYVNWQVERVKRIITNYPEFMGIEFAESYFRPNGDVSPFAREKFTKEYLKLDRETLSFDEIRNHAEWYKKWQEYGVDAIINFNQKIKDAVKSTNPDVLFAAWGMGWRNASSEKIGEHYWGLDNVRLVREVNPDILFLQTSWQDWMDPNLQPQYTKEYAHIVDTLKEANPNVVLGVQTDIASLSWSNRNNPSVMGIRDGEWWKAFMDLSLSIGYYTNTAYDYAFYKKQDLWIE